MTEKNFIVAAIEFIAMVDGALKQNVDDNELKKSIDKFLEYHHQTYFEVEFVKKEEEPTTFKGVPIVWDKVEHNIVSSLHCPARLIPFPMVLDESLPDDRIEIHDQNGEIYVLTNIQ